MGDVFVKHRVLYGCLGFLLGSLAGSASGADDPACGTGAPAPKAAVENPAEKPPSPGALKPGEPVTVEFFVMSQCPFAAQVEQGIAPVLEKFGPAIDFRLEFVGQDRDGVLSSMHGPSEIIGNKIQACVQKQRPASLLAMLGCMNQDMRSIPEGWDACAERLGLDVDQLAECFRGELGDRLLRASFKRAVEQGAMGSPTMFIAGRIYNGPRTEVAFSRAVCAAWAGKKPDACALVPEPARVPVTMLSDSRCPDCNESTWRKQLSSMFPGAVFTDLDFETEAGGALYAALGHLPLPLLVFGPEVEKAEEFPRIERHLLVDGDRRILLLGQWDPTLEICDNGKDDTGDGKADCEDEACKARLICRPAVPGKLEVYVMSQCPYGVLALNAMRGVLGKLGQGLKFEIHYIVDERDGEFAALHGPPEVAENIRQLCARDLYPENKRYLDFIWCRNADIRSDDWKSCAKGNGMDPDKLAACSEGERGRSLLSEDIKLAQGAAIGASPTWLANNKHLFHGIEAEAVVAAFCTHNPDHQGCEGFAPKPEEEP